MNETDTPRTDRAGNDGMYSTMVNHALGLERELNESKANQKALKQFENYCRIAIRDALNAANAPTHYPDIGAPARKPMTPVERIAELAKQRDALADKLKKHPCEIICTKCGLREQRGEKLSADF